VQIRRVDWKELQDYLQGTLQNFIINKICSNLKI
jgi:hypothetical protein